MKKAWYSSFEGIKAPIVIYIVAMVLISLGNTFEPTNEVLALIVDSLAFFGGLLKVLFPLFIVINVIGKRHEDSVPIICGIICYVLFHVVSLFVNRFNSREAISEVY